jgi:hypothetical protein
MLLVYSKSTAGKSIYNNTIISYDRGKGLGKEGQGISRPISVISQKDTEGVGYKSSLFEPWWDNLYDKVAIKIEVKGKRKEKREKREKIVETKEKRKKITKSKEKQEKTIESKEKRKGTRDRKSENT